jgi:hypothetical protein
MAAKIRGPGGPTLEPTHTGSQSQPTHSESATAPKPFDTVERSSSRAPFETVTTGLSAGLAVPKSERPLDAAVLARAMAVLEKLFADPAFVAALTALSVMPRLGHIVSAMAAATALLAFLGEWLTRGRSDTWMLAAALSSFAAIFPGAQLAALAGGAALAARTLRRRDRTALAVTVDDAQLESLMDEWLAQPNLAGTLADEDASDDLVALAAAAVRTRDALRQKSGHSSEEAKRLARIERWLESELPAEAIVAALGLGWRLRPSDLLEQPQTGCAWRIGTKLGIDDAVSAIAAHADHQDTNRLELRSAVCAYNGLVAGVSLMPGEVVYVPTITDVEAPLSGWAEIMPLPAGTDTQARQRLVALLPMLATGRADSLAARASRLLRVLDRMPARPMAYEVPEPLADAVVSEPAPEPA